MANFTVRAFLLLVFVSLCVNAFGQFSKVWENRYDQPGNSNESALKSFTDVAGNIYVVGNTQSIPYSTTDVILLKYSSNGSLLWKYQFGLGAVSTGNYKDFVVDSKGNSILLFDNCLLVKISSDGAVLWTKSFNASYKYPLVLQKDDADNIYAFSTQYDDFAVNKFSGDGTELWSKIWVASTIDQVKGGVVAGDKVVVWGLANQPGTGSKSVFVVYDQNGIFLWSKEDPSTSLGIGTILSGIFYVQLGNSLKGYNLTTGNLFFNYTFTDIFGFVPFSNLLTGPDGSLYVVYTENYQVRVARFAADHSFSVNIYNGYYTNRYTINDALLDSIANKVYVAVDLNIGSLPPQYSSVIQFNPDNTYTEIFPATSKSGVSIRSLSKDINGPINLFGSFDNAAYGRDFLMMQLNSTTLAKNWETSFVQRNTVSHKPEAICYDKDGNTYVAGRLASLVGASSAGGNEVGNYGVIKYDAEGNEVWRLKYLPDGLITNGSNTALAITINSNNELFVTGAVNLNASTSGGYPVINLYTIKVGSDGKVIWSQTYPVNSGELTIGFQVVADSEGNSYVLFAKRYSVQPSVWIYKLILLKYDAQGNKIWENSYDNSFPYEGLLSNGEDTNSPILKIIDNEIYVFNNNGYNVEIRRWDLSGNILLDKEITTADCQVSVCTNCWINLDAMDFTKGGDGNLYLLISTMSGGRLVSLSKEGNVLWINKGGNYNRFTFGSLALNANNEAYTILSGYTRIQYAKTGNDGKTIWSKTDTLVNYNNDLGQAAYVFLKEDGTPIFMGTNAANTSSSTRDYFFQERDKNSGTITYTSTFDGGYDGMVPYPYTQNSDDELVAFYKIPGKDEFIVTGSVGDKMRYSKTIVTMKFFEGTPSADFAADKIKVIENQPVTFQDKSSGVFQSWTWTFTGGTPSSYIGKNPPPISYSKAGTYPVSLEVKTFSGVSYVKTIQDYITVFQKLQADFKLPTVYAGQVTSFEDSSIGAIDSYQWNFQGATPSAFNGKSPTGIVFTNAGSYKVSLKISNVIDTSFIERSVTVEAITAVVPGKDSPVFYPNPSHGNLSTNYPVNEIVAIEVYNSVGVSVAKLETGNNEFSISGLANGIYFMKLTTTNLTFIQKVVKY